MNNNKEERNLKNPNEFIGYVNRLAKQMNMFSFKDLSELVKEEPKIVEDVVAEYNELKENVVDCVHAINDIGTLSRFTNVWTSLTAQEHKLQWLTHR